MKIRVLLTGILLLVSASAFGQAFTATLSGANEVPPADPDGSGRAVITIIGTTVNYTITVTNITLPPIGQHIHVGAAGVNGGIVVDLAGIWVGGTLTGSTTTTAAIAAAIIANPAGHYVNVHTTDFPGGSVRGQLAATDIPTLSGWSLIALGVVLAGAGLLLLRRI
jgi:hypothetical protein